MAAVLSHAAASIYAQVTTEPGVESVLNLHRLLAYVLGLPEFAFVIRIAKSNNDDSLLITICENGDDVAQIKMYPSGALHSDASSAVAEKCHAYNVAMGVTD